MDTAQVTLTINSYPPDNEEALRDLLFDEGFWSSSAANRSLVDIDGLWADLGLLACTAGEDQLGGKLIALDVEFSMVQEAKCEWSATSLVNIPGVGYYASDESDDDGVPLVGLPEIARLLKDLKPKALHERLTEMVEPLELWRIFNENARGIFLKQQEEK